MIEGLHGKFWRYFLLGGAASLAVTLANPAGFGLWGTSTGYIGNRYLVGHTAEYLPPNFHDFTTWPFLVMIGLLVLAFGLQQGRRSEAASLPAAYVLLAGAWLVMGLYSVRNVPLFAIASAPVLALALGDWLAASHHRVGLLKRFAALDRRLLVTEHSLRGALWPVAAVVLLAAGLGSGIPMDFQQSGNRFDPQAFPVQAVDWLTEHPQQGAVFNHFPWGGYLLYRLWPDQRVFIDGQTDFYGESLTRQYEQVITLSPGWAGVLEQYHVRWAILPAEGALTNALRGDPGWQVLYDDATAVILARGAP